jgi:hypothetical protein
MDCYHYSIHPHSVTRGSGCFGVLMHWLHCVEWFGAAPVDAPLLDGDRLGALLCDGQLGAMVFGKVIGKVLLSFAPYYSELLLLDSIGGSSKIAC